MAKKRMCSVRKTPKGWTYVSPGWSEWERQRAFAQPWVTDRIYNRSPNGAVLIRKRRRHEIDESINPRFRVTPSGFVVVGSLPRVARHSLHSCRSTLGWRRGVPLGLLWGCVCVPTKRGQVMAKKERVDGKKPRRGGPMSAQGEANASGSEYPRNPG